jgi:AcrR family transcriptional regulator
LNDQSNSSGSDTRERIIETARQLFYQNGYAATGISQILKASDSKSGSLYHFFPSKEHLLIAVLEKYRTMLDPMVIRPNFDAVSDPIERIFAVLDGYRKGLESTGFELGCPIGNLALEVGNDYPRARTLVRENFEAWCAAIEEQLRGALGRLPENLDPASLARHILAVMEGAVMLARTYRTLEPFDQAVEQLRDHMDRLLREGTDWHLPDRVLDRPGDGEPTR